MPRRRPEERKRAENHSTKERSSGAKADDEGFFGQALPHDRWRYCGPIRGGGLELAQRSSDLCVEIFGADRLHLSRLNNEKDVQCLDARAANLIGL
jgi:hypothetical protein